MTKQKTYMGRIELRFRGFPVKAVENHGYTLTKVLDFGSNVEGTNVELAESESKSTGEMIKRRIKITCRGFVPSGTQLGFSTEEIECNLRRGASHGILLAYNGSYKCGDSVRTGKELCKLLTSKDLADLTALIAHPYEPARREFGFPK